MTITFPKNTLYGYHLWQGGPSPHKHGEGFDAPPTLERSGSEHWRAVTSSLFRQETGLVRDVESSLEGGTRWFEEFRSHPPHKPHLSLQR